jgi:hypothetical protein
LFDLRFFGFGLPTLSAMEDVVRSMVGLTELLMDRHRP